MEDKPQDSPWDKLLDEVGAQPDESAFERHQPPPQEIPPTVDWNEAERMAAEAKAGPTDWNSLAGSLGLEVEEPAEPVEEPAATSPEEVELPDGFEFVESESEAAEAAEISEETLSSLEMPNQAAFLEEVETEVGEEEDETSVVKTTEIDSSAVEDELPPLPTQMDQAMSDTSWEEDSQDEGEAAGAEEGSEDNGGGISGEAARSAFDALFSDGASSWGSAFLAKPKPEDSIAGSKGDSSDDMFSADLGDPLSTKSSDDDGEEETDRPKRKRSRRRRRGGGKGRKPVGEGAAEGESGDDVGLEGREQAEGDDVDAKQKPKRRRSGQRSRTDEGGDTDFDDEAREGGSAPGGDRPPNRRQRHRNIPTWSEAIGMIVDANLEQRAKSPNKPQSSRGRGGRGGRRRGGGKKSENK